MDSRADTAVAIACVLIALLLLVLPAGPRETVSGAIRGNLLWPLAQLQERAVLTGRALSEHDSLRQVNDSVVQRSILLESVEEENHRLRSLLALGRSLGWGYIPAEALTARSIGESYSMLLSAGAEQGVERLSAVVSAGGLIGMVDQVDARTSVAIIWPHPDFRVSATSLDGQAFGIVTAHQGDRADRWLMELHGVAYRAELREGTPIVSSGLGGIFPRGVLIGTVLRRMDSSSSWARSYLLRPAVVPTEITSVIILKPERTAEGVESVWRVEAEELERRVRAAADSLQMLPPASGAEERRP